MTVDNSSTDFAQKNEENPSCTMSRYGSMAEAR
jgi:hypothetical protein